MPSLRVAAVQLNSQEDLEQNLEQCRLAISRAAELGAVVVVLPENFAIFGGDAERRRVAETLETAAPIQDTLRNLARGLGLSIVAGGFPEKSSDPARPYNTCWVVGQSGETLAAYRKIHLFDVDLADGTRLAESDAATAGSEPSVVELSGFRFGLSICYDLRFPELYRSLVERGAEVLLVPAAFTLHTGKDHWHVLLRARAIEAQCWVVAAAQWGKHQAGRTTYGHSLVCDPWGTIVAECPDGLGVIVHELDRERLVDVRRQLPALAHRRLR